MASPALHQPIDARSLIVKLLMMSSAGAGTAIAWFALKLVAADPKLAMEMVKTVAGWGPLSVIAIIGVVQADRRAADNLRVQTESARAMQALADGVRQIAEKDDRAVEESRRMLTFIGTKQEEILERLSEYVKGDKAKGASA